MESPAAHRRPVRPNSVRPAHPPRGARPADPGQLDAAIDRTAAWLLDHQHPDGHWCAELEGDSILESEYLLLLAWLGREQSNDALAAARSLVDQQLPTGGWSMYPGGKLEISGSVKAYFALKLAGHDPAAEYMVRAREAIRAAGGADAVNSFTRFYLALLGQISYDHCPAVPPELVLLPDWSPINIYRMSAWSRTIVVPLSIMWAHRPVRQIEAERGIDELFLKPPDQWPELRCPGLAAQSGIFTWDNFFRTVDRSFKYLDRWRIKPLRNAALKRASQWMLDRFEKSDGLGAIFPPIIWSVVALKCLGYSDDSREVQDNLSELEKLTVREEDRLWLQPCLSPVWDTVITLRALASAGYRQGDEPIARATEWLLSKEVRSRGDWSRQVKCEPGGWFFEYENEFYPDVDDTIMAMMALRDTLGDQAETTLYSLVITGKAANAQAARTQAASADRIVSAVERATRWVLAMQNRDGGWGAFDRDNDDEFLCRVPFADHNAMIDPSTPDIAGRVIESLAAWGMSQSHGAVRRAIAYIRRMQEPDGAWFGRWGVNYIYGTWQVLVGLAAVGVPPNDPAVRRGVQWLLAHQQSCGGWGESADSYEQPELRGQGTPTPSQTAWAVLGLIAAGQADHESVRGGVQYLLDTQQPDGTWDETEFTGTGFPRVFYLRYHYYRIYFPLLALGKYREAVENR
jgi:squalene-hopene/tetraprenyl-beta-curcumene cyclase